MSILNNILEKKRNSILGDKQALPLSEIKKTFSISELKEREFLKSLKEKEQEVKLIAEIKKASPSKGKILNSDVDIVKLAKLYQINGASALSVVTEKDFFKGGVEDLIKIRQSTNLAVLRKDFIIDEYQIYQSKFYQADAILLITNILTSKELKRFSDLARELKMDVIFEINNREDLDTVLELNPLIIGINNRNLDTLETDINISSRLLPEIPEGIFKISESAIKNYQDILYLKSLGANAFLVGEAILTAKDIASQVRRLLGYGQS